jgi:hypothetical protein
MASPGALDLLGLDRDVARAARSLERWRSEGAARPDDDEPVDPFEGVRHVASKSTWDALAAAAPSALDVPLRDALKRWVAAFLLARLNLGDEITLARASAEPVVAFDGDPPRLETWHGLWRAIAASRTAAEARRWLQAGAGATAPLAEVNRRRAARRVEAARRLGAEHPWSLATGVSAGAVRAAASRLLDATEDIARASRREALGGSSDAAAVIHLAVGRDAGDGWPAHLTPRWVDEAVGAAASGLKVALPPLPPALGAASFARALRLFGRRLRLASSPASLPFGLRREPAFVAARRSGDVFGALVAEQEFHARVLHLAHRRAAAQARVLARTALVEARLEAARTILADDARFAPADTFDELTTRAFGAPLDLRYAAAWPSPRDDDPAAFLGLVGAQALRQTLRERFDVDWFRNPRAWAHLRASSAAPAFEPTDEAALLAGAEALGRAFEQALG